MVSVVIGASRGIGLALAQALCDQGATVLATARRSNEQLDALRIEVVTGVDITDDASLDAVSRALKGRHISLLIVASGIQEHDTLQTTTKESIRRQLEVNALGPLFAVRKLQPHLQQGGKVVLLSSKNASLAETEKTGGDLYGYRLSKAALNMAGATLALDLRKLSQAPLGIIHPGAVLTDMLTSLRRKMGFSEDRISAGTVTPQEAAARVLKLVAGLSLENSGTYWAAENGRVIPW